MDVSSIDSSVNSSMGELPPTCGTFVASGIDCCTISSPSSGIQAQLSFKSEGDAVIASASMVAVELRLLSVMDWLSCVRFVSNELTLLTIFRKR